MLEVTDLSVSFGSHKVVDQVSFTVAEGEWLMLVGPNGAGKSTIINAISRGVDHQGQVRFRGADVQRMKPQALARCLGVLAQSHHVGYSFTVEEVVRLGRYAYTSGLFSAGSDDDEEKIAAAIDLTGLRPLLRQSVLTLSGGELQRAFLAQLLAQDPQLLILDEPTNHLDLVYQKQTFALINDWLRQPGRAVVSVVHDLSLARAYGSHALLLHQGRGVALGLCREVLCSAHLDSVYDMDVAAWLQQLLSQWSGAAEKGMNG